MMVVYAYLDFLFVRVEVVENCSVVVVTWSRSIVIVAAVCRHYIRVSVSSHIYVENRQEKAKGRVAPCVNYL